MRIRIRCSGCSRIATVRSSHADLLYYCERCCADSSGETLTEVRDFLASLARPITLLTARPRR